MRKPLGRSERERRTMRLSEMPAQMMPLVGVACRLETVQGIRSEHTAIVYEITHIQRRAGMGWLVSWGIYPDHMLHNVVIDADLLVRVVDTPSSEVDGAGGRGAAASPWRVVDLEALLWCAYRMNDLPATPAMFSALIEDQRDAAKVETKESTSRVGKQLTWEKTKDQRELTDHIFKKD